MNNEKALYLQNVTVLFDIAWDTYKRCFMALLKLNFIPVLVGIAVAYGFTFVGDFERISDYLEKSDVVAIVAFIFGIAIILLGKSDNESTENEAVADKEEGTNLSVENTYTGEFSTFKTYSLAAKLLFPYLWLMLLGGLIVLLGFALLVVPGIVFSIWFVFSAFFLVFKNIRGKEALRKSKRYVKGIWSEVLNRLIAGALFGLLLNIALEVFKSFLTSISSGSMDAVSINILLDFIFQLVVSPYFVVYIFELYNDVVQVNEYEYEVVE